MNNLDKITLADINTSRNIFFKLAGSVLLVIAVTIISKPHEGGIGLTFLGLISVPFILALIVKQIQGTLTSMELSADALIFNYAYILSNQIKCRPFKYNDITKIEYSGSFLNRLTVISRTDKLSINIDDSERTPVKSFVETVNRRRGVRVA